MYIHYLSLSKYLSNKSLQVLTIIQFLLWLFSVLTCSQLLVLDEYWCAFPVLQSTLCLVKPPSFLSICSFGYTLILPIFFTSSSINRTLFSCSFFLTLNNLEVSPTYTTFFYRVYQKKVYRWKKSANAKSA